MSKCHIVGNHMSRLILNDHTSKILYALNRLIYLHVVMVCDNDYNDCVYNCTGTRIWQNLRCFHAKNRDFKVV